MTVKGVFSFHSVVFFFLGHRSSDKLFFFLDGVYGSMCQLFYSFVCLFVCLFHRSFLSTSFKACTVS